MNTEYGWAEVNRMMNNALMRGKWPKKKAIDAYHEAMNYGAISVDESL